MNDTTFREARRLDRCPCGGELSLVSTDEDGAHWNRLQGYMTQRMSCRVCGVSSQPETRWVEAPEEYEPCHRHADDFGSVYGRASAYPTRAELFEEEFDEEDYRGY